MPSILSKLLMAHSNGLTPRSCKKKDASYDVVSEYYTGVRGNLEKGKRNLKSLHVLEATEYVT